MTVELVSSDGTVRGSDNWSINALGSMSGELFADLFEGVTPDKSDYIRVTADRGFEGQPVKCSVFVYNGVGKSLK
jgi:hypothetical protein